MLILGLLLFCLAVGLCLVAIRKWSRALDMKPIDVLRWFGLAETPVQQTRRRV